MVGDYAASENLGRRALGLPGGLGLCAEKSGWQRRESREFVTAGLPARTGARLGCAWRYHDLCAARHGRWCWHGENEAFLALQNSAKTSSKMVTPSISILAEPSVSVVDVVADRHGTRKAADEYVKYLYSPEAQETAARHFYGPRLEAVATEVCGPVSEGPACSPWMRCSAAGKKAQKTHFADGGVFDQIYLPNQSK